jgi:hypothetical protein
MHCRMGADPNGAWNRRSVMNLQLLSFLLGALLLLVGILGGGFEIKEVKVPKVGAMPRLGAFIVGVFFLYVGFVGHESLLNGARKPAGPAPEVSQPAPQAPDAGPTPMKEATREPVPEPAAPERSEPSARATEPGARIDLMQAFHSALAPAGPREKDPLDDPRVRRAVELSLRQTDIDQARRLLAEAGYRDGFALHLRMSRFLEAGASVSAAEMLTHNLALVGIRVESTPD